MKICFYFTTDYTDFNAELYVSKICIISIFAEKNINYIVNNLIENIN